jgi:hypothetical protein
MLFEDFIHETWNKRVLDVLSLLPFFSFLPSLFLPKVKKGDTDAGGVALLVAFAVAATAGPEVEQKGEPEGEPEDDPPVARAAVSG